VDQPRCHAHMRFDHTAPHASPRKIAADDVTTKKYRPRPITAVSQCLILTPTLDADRPKARKAALDLNGPRRWLRLES